MSQHIKRDLDQIFTVIKSNVAESEKHEQIKKILKANVKLVGIFLKKTNGGRTGDVELDKSLNNIPQQYLRISEGEGYHSGYG